MALDKVTTGVIADDAVTGTQIAPNAIEITDVAADVIPVKPHIQLGVLQPAVDGKLLDGTTSHGSNGSTAYGTAQVDGHSYYWTSIKGSKAIKDPRIGAHFGSHRHTFTSIQRLELESATHGLDVYSTDGREWVRLVDGGGVTNGRWRCTNNLHGVYLNGDGGSNYGGMFFEVTGYFNDINFLLDIDTSANNDIDIFVNGTKTIDGSTTLAGDSATSSPLGSRYVRRSSVINVGDASLGTTPAINTLKYYINSASGKVCYLTGIELIAQDTTSTANKSKIQIPAQNVVSYGKKFTIGGSSAATHYDPFNGMSGAKTLTQLGTYIDTGTSLGMENWKAGTSNYYKPFNGGRVVKWIDSTGAIKTSVTMMPPNGQNYSATASNAYSNAEIQAGTNNHTITYDTTTIANATPLSEVAKTFNFREFGNGCANASTGATPWADASMLASDVYPANGTAYVMDDGLTSGWGATRMYGRAVGPTAADTWVYWTFIGTGLSMNIDQSATPVGWKHLGQNLPYGTHILGFKRVSNNALTETYLNGILLNSNGLDLGGGIQACHDITYHQPKRPPIPEDAVIISDYMLMADFVGMATTGTSVDKISKGVRMCSLSRDVFSAVGAHTLEKHILYTGGLLNKANGASSGGSDYKQRMQAFGTNFVVRGATSGTRNVLHIDDTSKTATASTVGNQGDFSYLASNEVLGVHNFGANSANGQTYHNGSFEIVTPIHTSSHYQEFETPFLRELVGGDRNMEQTNLIVTPDGKSWDEVTRDTSYISKNLCLSVSHTNGHFTTDGFITPLATRFRGIQNTNSEKHECFQKDWAIGYDRFICLVDGIYNIKFLWYHHSAHNSLHLNKNGSHTAGHQARSATGDETVNGDICDTFKRGDWFALHSSNGGTVDGGGRNLITITRVE